MVSVESIIQAARDEGIADFSMLAIAKRLNITHGALYRYFPSRHELAVAVIDAVVEETGWDRRPESWRQLLLEFARVLWMLCRRTPGLASSMLSLPRTPRAFRRVLDDYVCELEVRGICEEDATAIVELISDEVLLNAQRLASDPQSEEPGLERLPVSGWEGEIGLLDRKLAIIFDGARVR